MRGFFELSTDGVPAGDRLEFWFETTGRRMACVAAETDAPVEARMAAMSTPDGEFVDYASRSFLMERNRAMCVSDDRDDISIGLVMSETTGAVQNDRELALDRGDLYVIDFGRPVRSIARDHHELAIFLPRQIVKRALGPDFGELGALRLPTQGVGALLIAHMQAMASEAAALTPAQRTIAMRIASDLALALLQSVSGGRADHARLQDGLHAAARAAIEAHCGDHQFTPLQLAERLGCSRATLYRVFASRGEGVAEAIWTARLKRAQLLLHRRPLLPVSEVAFQSGFLDHSSFGRMYRRHFGHSPRDERDRPMSQAPE